jgi:hypothetical protein
MTLTWYRHFQRNGGLNQILRRQASRFHYGSKVLILSVFLPMNLAFPLEDCLEFGNFVITLITR